MLPLKENATLCITAAMNVAQVLQETLATEENKNTTTILCFPEQQLQNLAWPIKRHETTTMRQQ